MIEHRLKSRLLVELGAEPQGRVDPLKQGPGFGALWARKSLIQNFQWT